MADPLAEAAVSNSGPVRDIITAPWMAYRVRIATEQVAKHPSRRYTH